MQVGNDYFLGEYRDALDKIQSETQYLKDLKETPQNIMMTCPFHKDGQESKPSCGISLYDRKRGDKTIPEGTVHCFTCNTTMSFIAFISHCYGYDDRGIYGFNWLCTHFGMVSIEDRKVVNFIEEEKVTEAPNWHIEKESLLQYYQYQTDYLLKRGISHYVQDLFEIGYSHTTYEVIFPVYDKDIKLIGLAKRNVKTKIYRNEFEKSLTLYGIHIVMSLLHKIKKLYIVEGFIDCLTLWSFGIPAIALCGAHATDMQIELLNSLPIRHYVIMLDNYTLDEAGKKGAIYLQKKLNAFSTIYQYAVPKKDANDLTYEEFLKGEEKICI